MGPQEMSLSRMCRSSSSRSLRIPWTLQMPVWRGNLLPDLSMSFLLPYPVLCRLVASNALLPDLLGVSFDTAFLPDPLGVFF